MWSAFRRAAADPRVQQKAIKTAVTVDKKLTETADKVVEFAAEKDPMREAGRMFGKLMSGGNDKK
jgi:hypothetical protein|tara:strand:+ start:1178 stop:1372 length:195 start_codon:yes stop_codon:yes gene_type:complete